MSTVQPGGRTAGAARRRPVSGGAVRGARCPGIQRRAAWLAAASAATVLLAVACGGPPGSAAPPGQALYQRALSYSRCMRAHGVPDFPILERGPGGTLIHPVRPPGGMLSAPGYDAAFRTCLKLAVAGGGARARYRAIALKALKQAECMRAHGITSFPSPGAIDGGLHVPDYTVLGLDPHTLRFQAAARACGMGGTWQALWWWPAGLTGP